MHNIACLHSKTRSQSSAAPPPPASCLLRVLSATLSSRGFCSWNDPLPVTVVDLAAFIQ